MLTHANVKSVVLFLLLGFTAAGCAGDRIKATPLPAGADPTEEISKLESNLIQAHADQTDYFAPNHFSKAEKKLVTAKNLRAENRANREVLEPVAEGHAYLSEAKKRAAVARLKFRDLEEARNRALDAGALSTNRGELFDLDQRLMELAGTFEEGQKVSERAHNTLLTDFKKLQLRADRENFLGETKNVIAMAEREGAQQWAPKTLREVQTKVSKIDKLISKAPGDKTEITNLSEDARVRAEFLLDVTRRSKLVETRNPEESVLKMTKQTEKIAALEETTAQKEQALAQERARMMRLEEKTAAEARFQRIRASFTPEEAEVIRTNGHIVLRLKGLKFQSAKAEIASENFELLSKVEKALAEFGDKKITVEGHTDSTGSREANQVISTKRAESVKNYLIASDAATPENINAEGKGFMEPIAPNQTQAGRALNRRVDIIIEQVSS